MPIFNSKNKSEIEITRQAMEACECIISEMGAELHDDLIQRLSILKLSIDKLERSISNPEEAAFLLQGMKGEFQEVIQSVRKISRKLLPAPLVNNSFSQGLMTLCQNMERPGAGTIHFKINGEDQKLIPLTEAYLYRIVQELMHNAFKHSSAWHIWVNLTWTPEKLRIEVQDDGTSFAKISEFIDVLRRKHNTLNMRIQVIGATIEYVKGEKGLLAIVECSI